MFVRQLNEVIIDVIPSDDGFAVGQREDYTAKTYTICRLIPMKPVIASHQIAGPCQHTKMLKQSRTIVADFHVVCIGIEPDFGSHLASISCCF